MIQVTISKILSLIIAIGYAACMVLGGHGVTLDVCKGLLALLFPLVLIWFSDQIGDATGYMIGNWMQVDTPTPAILISMMGWFFLVGLPVLMYFLG